jgi:phosphatidylserine/phosphatidylglycerophosphate/cardiolipin synthase-like enzyme
MRVRAQDDVLTVHAVTGTHVVMLGMDVKQAKAKGLLGFAIHRTDPKEKESYWLTGMRTFEASYPNPPEGALVSSWEHPIQDFLWSDFTAKPGRSYTYLVVPMYGQPKNLQPGQGVSVKVSTEKEAAGVHSVYFNRGVIGSQAYARKWNAVPSKLPPTEAADAWRWLSRGLEEAILAFIGKAKDKTYSLRAAVYEFDHDPVGAAFGQALQRCGDVKIVYDARISQSKTGVPDADATRRVGRAAALLAAHGLTDSAIPRKADPNYIAHNKFIVLLKKGKPVEVWTGSTNFTESGIFGQANVGHAVRDPKIAQRYLDYWNHLSLDPDAKDHRQFNETNTPTLKSLPPPSGITPLFSPRPGTKQLQWYADALDSAGQLNCFTAAFGVNDLFLDDYAVDKNFLRYVFLEKWGVSKALAEKAQKSLSLDPDVQVAVGSTFTSDGPINWRKELLNTISTNVRYVHTKFMLVDPLGEDPVVVSGSANFSDASTSQNDENMLVIRGDKRVADIYLGEFMRLWRHHHFRGIVQKPNPETGLFEPNYLSPDDRWVAGFYKADTVKFRRRLAFA